jgi:hypothetical protein
MQRLTITNSLGQNLMNSLVSDKSMTETAFDISQLANGVYYILVEQDFGSKTYKFVVER